VVSENYFKNIITSSVMIYLKNILKIYASQGNYRNNQLNILLIIINSKIKYRDTLQEKGFITAGQNLAVKEQCRLLTKFKKNSTFANSIMWFIFS
jgi:hypothetical protein